LRPAGVSTFGREIEWRPQRGASADGHHAGDILAPNFSPSPGTDRQGQDVRQHLGGMPLCRQPVPDRDPGKVSQLLDAGLGEAAEWARGEGRPMIVATFDPHPVRHFAPHVPPFRLTSLDQREELFRAAGASAMLVFHFDDELASTGAEDFVAALLAARIGAAGVVTGEDFTFGRGRSGNRETLAALGAQHGIAARAVGPVMEGGMAVSSSRIRDALKAGDCEAAARLMTRPFAIRAAVQRLDLEDEEIRVLQWARLH